MIIITINAYWFCAYYVVSNFVLSGNISKRRKVGNGGTHIYIYLIGMFKVTRIKNTRKLSRVNEGDTCKANCET